MYTSIKTSLVAALAVGSQFAAGAATKKLDSVEMALSMKARGDGIMTGLGDKSEILQTGFTQKTFSALIAQYPDESFTAEITDHIIKSVESVAPLTLNASFNAETYPLDRLSSGNALLKYSQDSSQPNQDQFKQAAEALRDSIDLNVRNKEGGLWYYVYPNWSYLDGMYSLAPFYTTYSLTAGSGVNETALDDMQQQIDLLWQHTSKQFPGLLVHGYDESREAVWADPTTGASPHVWGRSFGWFVMALVDVAELLENDKERQAPLLDYFNQLLPGIFDAHDSATDGFWQVLDRPGEPGNYIESSGTAMIAYALLKAVRLGYIERDFFNTQAGVIGVLGQRYMATTFVIPEDDGTVGWNGTVSVCSLNSTADYEYYTNQPIEYNNVLGSNAYILASLEMELVQQKSQNSLRDLARADLEKVFGQLQ